MNAVVMDDVDSAELVIDDRLWVDVELGIEAVPEIPDIESDKLAT